MLQQTIAKHLVYACDRILIEKKNWQMKLRQTLHLIY